MRKEEGKVREGMTDEEREVKMGKREENRDNGRRGGKCFMTHTLSHGISS